MNDLYSFFYWGDYNAQMAELAKRAQSEPWSFGNINDYSILKNYMKHTFQKLQSEGKIVTAKYYCIFNTGLYDNYNEPIYVYAEPNNRLGYSSWIFKGFKDRYELGDLKIIDLPERADYFSDPGKLIFNWHYPVNVHYEHILDDLNTAQRLPERIRTSDLALETLKGVIDSSIQKVTANYKLAIPHYYNNRIQLMIPLYFNKNNIPDVALALNEIDGKCYQARTCLSMKMAYIDARIISKPDVFWLSFDTINAREEE